MEIIAKHPYVPTSISGVSCSSYLTMAQGLHPNLAESSVGIQDGLPLLPEVVSGHRK